MATNESIADGRLRRSVIKAAEGSGIAGAAGAGAGGASGVTMVDGHGPVITTADVYLIYWGSSWAGTPTPSSADVTTAVQKILIGPYMSALLQYRGVGHGVFFGQTSVTSSNPPATFSNANVIGVIQGLLDKGTLPEPDQDSRILYVVVMPPNVQFTNPNTTGEHTSFFYTDADNPADSRTVHYAWVTNGGTLDSVTAIFSHELAEACSDPEGTAFQIVPANANSWNEIGDSGCGCQSNNTRLNGVLVQKYWSQRDNACVAPVVEPATHYAVAWGANRLDIFGLGTDGAMYHKAWDGGAWQPSPTGWENLGGLFTSPPAVVSWGANRLDIFGLGADSAMYHKAWDGHVWQANWENLGGFFTSPPAAVAWGANRLDVFGLGGDHAMYHKAWDGNAWQASWENLGGFFTSPPAAVAWGANRLDVFGLGGDHAMYHKAWVGNGWQANWENLGGAFISPPAVASWGSNRLDVFGLGTDGSMFHKAWDGSAWQSAWEGLGGVFSSPPAVVSWGINRLDIFGLGTDGSMFHKAWDGAAWRPSQTGWEPQGGAFSSPPGVVAWGSNRLDVFGLGTNRSMYHKAWDGQHWQAAWETLGGIFAAP